MSDGSNVLLMETQYSYGDTGLSNAQFLTPLGAKEGSLEYLYENNLLTRENTLSISGKVEKYISYEYQSGRKSQAVYYKGKVENFTISYSYDDKGNLISETAFNRDDTIRKVKTFEYDSYEYTYTVE